MVGSSTTGPATGVATLAAPGVAVGCSRTGGSALYGPRIVFPKGSVARRCDNNCPSRAAAGWSGSPRRLTTAKAPGAETRVAGPLETPGAGSANAGSSDVRIAKTHPSLGTFNHCRKQSVPALLTGRQAVPACSGAPAAEEVNRDALLTAKTLAKFPGCRVACRFKFGF